MTNTKTTAIIIIVVGIIALPTPAPGWLIIAAGVKLLRSASVEQINPIVETVEMVSHSI